MKNKVYIIIKRDYNGDNEMFWNLMNNIWQKEISGNCFYLSIHNSSSDLCELSKRKENKKLYLSIQEN